MLSKEMGTWTRVLVDVEDYRGRRERQLRELAERAAARVVETGKMLQLEPMPALERRWIHIALREHPERRDAVDRRGAEPPRRRRAAQRLTRIRARPVTADGAIRTRPADPGPVATPGQDVPAARRASAARSGASVPYDRSAPIARGDWTDGTSHRRPPAAPAAPTAPRLPASASRSSSASLAALALGAGALYAYDQQYAGGSCRASASVRVDLSGLTPTAARAVLDAPTRRSAMAGSS